MIKLDIGAGVQKRSGFIGIDKVADSQVDVVLDFLKEKLPYEDSSVEEIFCGDVIEHLAWKEMVILMNKIWRVLIPNGKLEVRTVFGIDGWKTHPTHIRPIWENQFAYFEEEILSSPTLNHMRKADGIIAVFRVIKVEKETNGLLGFKLEAIK